MASAERNILRCINKVSKKLLYKKNRHLRSISNPTGVKTKGRMQHFCCPRLYYIIYGLHFLQGSYPWAIKSSLESEYSCLFSSFICVAAEHVGLWNFFVFMFNTYSVFAVSAETSVLSPDKELTPVA